MDMGSWGFGTRIITIKIVIALLATCMAVGGGRCRH